MFHPLSHPVLADQSNPAWQMLGGY